MCKWSVKGMNRNLCSNCGADVTELPDEPRLPCLKCGGIGRTFTRTAHECLLTPKETLKSRVKRQGKSKPKIESISGYDLHRKTGRWNKKIRIIDEEKDYYRETITDPETGEVIHHDESKLSDHRDHGTAKYPRKKKS
jgi:hypothetical protein